MVKNNILFAPLTKDTCIISKDLREGKGENMKIHPKLIIKQLF